MAESIGPARVSACYMIDDLTGAWMLHNGRYFKYGTKRLFEELAKLPDSEPMICKIQEIAQARDQNALQTACVELLRMAQTLMQKKEPKRMPSADLAGTYEEMYSNWRNKVELAAKTRDAFYSFANLCGVHGMLADITQGYDLPEQNVMGEYDPDHSDQNVALFDHHLQLYEQAYEKAGICVKRYADIDEFVTKYLQN